MNLERTFEDKEILICCGSGGVGKTTAAASIALEEARRGRRVLVLTIDPARRLANAMGLEELGNRESPIPQQTLRDAGIRPDGELHGMMLDTKRTFDELIDRISPTPEKRDQILSNKYYHTLSNALAGSQEYMAMEKLHEIHKRGDYEFIVLDTPPTRHALDFLEAPRRMSDFLEGKVIQWMLKPYMIAGRAGFRFLHRSTTSILGIMEKVTGMEAMKGLAEFFMSFEGLYDGFKDRAKNVNRLLKSKRTCFLLVASPNKLILRETRFFAEKLMEFEMPLGGFVFNRVHPDYIRGARSTRRIQRMLRDRSWSDRLFDGSDVPPGEADAYAQVVESLLSNFLRAQKLADADRAGIEGFLSRFPMLPWKTVPFFDDEIHDLRGLARMGEILYR